MLFLEVFLEFDVCVEYALDNLESVGVETQGRDQDLEAVLGVEIPCDVPVRYQRLPHLTRFLRSQLVQTVLLLRSLRWLLLHFTVFLTQKEFRDKVQVLLSLEQFRVAHDFAYALVDLDVFSGEF